MVHGTLDFRLEVYRLSAFSAAEKPSAQLTGDLDAGFARELRTSSQCKPVGLLLYYNIIDIVYYITVSGSFTDLLRRSTWSCRGLK